MTSSGVLDEAYGRLHRSGPEFGGDADGNHGLANHGPMAVEVILRRGIDLDVQGWLDSYVRRLEELPGRTERITGESWRPALGGGRRRVGDWTAYFLAEVADRPWRDVLVTWWPRLLPGIVAGSTHGVIRVGHAVRTLAGGDESADAVAELAHGLAYWAARSRPLPGLRPPAGELGAAAALAAVPHLPDQSGVIAGRVTRLGEVDRWPAALAALRPAIDDAGVPARLAELVDAATVRYLRYGHGAPVLLVHAATAPNAVLHTLPQLPRELWDASLTAAWAASAAVVAMYEPAAPADDLPGAPADADPAAEVLARAAEHGDEHVLKFSDTAVDVFDRTGDPGALAAALRAGELIGR